MEIFHYKNVALKNKLMQFDPSFLKNHKKCERFTMKKNLIKEGSTDTCLIEVLTPMKMLMDIDIINEIGDYYVYSDNLTKFFCQNL
jgi:hypothetical protein